jgi:hypothetical protein
VRSPWQAPSDRQEARYESVVEGAGSKRLALHALLPPKAGLLSAASDEQHTGSSHSILRLTDESLVAQPVGIPGNDRGANA